MKLVRRQFIRVADCRSRGELVTVSHAADHGNAKIGTFSCSHSPAVKSRQSRTISDRRCLRCWRSGRKRLSGRYIRIHSHRVRPSHASTARGIAANGGRGHIFHMVSIKVS